MELDVSIAAAASRRGRSDERQAFRYKGISTLYQDVVCIHQHQSDGVFSTIITNVAFDLVSRYLLVQSSQWHTIHSKQFSLYESMEAGRQEEEDGLETIVYLLDYLFSHLPGLSIVLTGNSVEECTLPYFCTMLSDRLRAEPYLLNSYLRLLASMASTSPSSAEAVYQFIDTAPSEHVSWSIMVNALNECEKLIATDGGQRSLLNTDLTGLVAMLRLMIQVLRHTSNCPNILASLQVNTVHLCIRLLYQPIHVMLKAELLAFLTCIASNASYAQLILEQLEVGHILDSGPQQGLLYELETVESSFQAYPLTLHFLELVKKLIEVLGVSAVVASPVFPHICSFALHHVFAKYDFLTYLPSRSGEKWKLASESLAILSEIVSYFPAVCGSPSSDASELVKTRLCDTVGELLSADLALQKLFSLLQLSPSHSLLDYATLPSDCIAESSLFVDSQLFDSYGPQLHLLIVVVTLLQRLLGVSTEAISRLGLHSSTHPSALVTSLASQLLTDSHSALSLFLCATSTGSPSLQRATFGALRLFCDQVNQGMLISILDKYPTEVALVQNALISLLFSVLFTQTPEEVANQAVHALLDWLLAHARSAFPSVTSLLVFNLQSLSAGSLSPSESVLGTLLAFVNDPVLVAFHVQAASKVLRLLWLLCSHQEVGFKGKLEGSDRSFRDSAKRCSTPRSV